MLEGAKSIGAGAATIALAGAAIGIGNVFSSLINSVARNPSFCLESFVKLFSDIHFRLVIIIVESSPLLRMAFSIALIVSTSSSICFMFGGGSGGIEDAIVPFLSRNGNPDPGLPPSSSGEPLGLVIAGQGETSTSLLEIPSVAEEDLWDAVDLQEQPLISDAERREILVEKLLEHGLNPDTKRSSALLEEQIIFEKTLEKHLRRCGYTDKDIGRVFPELRPKFLYYRGKARKIEDLTKWIRDMELNFKGSSPYKKIQNLLILFTPQELGKE